MAAPKHVCDNYIAGAYKAPVSGKYLDVLSPTDDQVISKVALSSAPDVDYAVAKAKEVRRH
jgi:betaine-aldehyde dehydrogenase